MSNKIIELLQRAATWPEDEQAELVAHAREIGLRHSSAYHATSGELAAIDEAERGGTATDEEVNEAFRAFRPA